MDDLAEEFFAGYPQTVLWTTSRPCPIFAQSGGMLTIPSFGAAGSVLNRCSQMTAASRRQGGRLSAIAQKWQSEPHGPFGSAADGGAYMLC